MSQQSPAVQVRSAALQQAIQDRRGRCGAPVKDAITLSACEGLATATDQVFTDASAIADSEEPAQDLFNKLASDLCRLGNRGLRACDTLRREPRRPHWNAEATVWAGEEWRSTVPKHGQQQSRHERRT